MSNQVEGRGVVDLSVANQGELFIIPTTSSNGIHAVKANETYSYIPVTKKNHYQLHSRRYIGSKYKLIDWIFSILLKKCEGNSFADIFAGTGTIAAVASKHFSNILVNDFLYSNYVIYQAFFSAGEYCPNKLEDIMETYNKLDSENMESNYFSDNFGGKYFSLGSAKTIGFIRNDIESKKKKLTEREYNLLLTSLLYSMDKIANTVGHYDAYFRKESVIDNFVMKPINPIAMNNISIHREDTNMLVKQIQADIVYIDPPYNSRQYSRFYHILENVTKWDKPSLYGTALKPEAENMSDYCRVSAFDKFSELINDIKAKYIAVSYNNTYDSKSNSSRNKINLAQIKDVLDQKGNTEIFEKEYRHFNAGKTSFNGHKEYLFVTKTANGA